MNDLKQFAGGDKANSPVAPLAYIQLATLHREQNQFAEAAKVMEDDPVALRMKELETLEKVTEKIDKISVYGGLDSVLKDLVKIVPAVWNGPPLFAVDIGAEFLAGRELLESRLGATVMELRHGRARVAGSLSQFHGHVEAP